MNPNLYRLINAWKSLTVLVIGDVMLDCYLNGYSDRLCQEAPVPVVAVTQRHDFPGGAGNTAANITGLGAKALLLSVIGNDSEGDRLQQALNQRSISTEHLLRSDEQMTLAKQRITVGSHLIARLDQGSTEMIAANLEKLLIQKLVTLFPQCDAVIVSDYRYGILTPRIIQTFADLQAKYSRVLVIDSKQLNAYQTVGATAVKPNYGETVQLLNLPKQLKDRATQIAPYGERILSLSGAKIAAVTLDTEGAIVFEKGQPSFRLQAQPVPQNQASGAGDTFVSALTLALAMNTPTPIATSLAAAATAIVVQQRETSVCSADELLQYAMNSSFNLAQQEGKSSSTSSRSTNTHVDSTVQV